MVNTFLLAGDKCMPEMHLKQPGFTYSACEPFNKSKERIQKFKETGDTKYIYTNESDNACFQHEMAYCDFKDLNRGIFADKVLCDKAFNVAKDAKYDGYQPGPASMVYKLSDNSGVNAHADNEIKQNHQLSGELHEPIIRNFRKRTVYYGFKNNIWGADLADMQLISTFNKRFRILLCAIGIYSKYAWVVPLKDKKGVNTNAFQKI